MGTKCRKLIENHNTMLKKMKKIVPNHWKKSTKNHEKMLKIKLKLTRNMKKTVKNDRISSKKLVKVGKKCQKLI